MFARLPPRSRRKRLRYPPQRGARPPQRPPSSQRPCPRWKGLSSTEGPVPLLQAWSLFRNPHPIQSKKSWATFRTLMRGGVA
jgi:hypothetical protein